MPGPVLPALLLALAAAAPPPAGDTPASGKVAKEAVAAFDAVPAKDPAARAGALRTLRGVVHPVVADRLLRLATARDEDGPLRTEAFLALAGQGDAAARLAPAVARWLAEEAKEGRRATARGDFGFPVDRKTGEPILDTEEGKAAVAALRARGRRAAAALALVRAWNHRTPALAEDVRFFLQDGTDELAVEALRTLAAWKDADSLPALAELFDMYPAEGRWATGAVVHPGGTNASARAAWMGRFGDPGKRRPRPPVVKALREALREITGGDRATPEDLRAWMESRKGESRGSRR